MGDRYYLSVICPYCGQMNNDVFYAPTSMMLDAKCAACKKRFFIAADFSAVKAEDWTIAKEKEAFKMASNFYTDEEIDEMYKDKKLD